MEKVDFNVPWERSVLEIKEADLVTSETEHCTFMQIIQKANDLGILGKAVKTVSVRDGIDEVHGGTRFVTFECVEARKPL